MTVKAWSWGSDEGDSPSSSLKEGGIGGNHRVPLESMNDNGTKTFILKTPRPLREDGGAVLDGPAHCAVIRNRFARY